MFTVEAGEGGDALPGGVCFAVGVDGGLAVALAKGTALHAGDLGVDDARGLPAFGNDLVSRNRFRVGMGFGLLS